MFRHTKLPQFEAKLEKPEPVCAHKLQELIGGARFFDLPQMLKLLDEHRG